MRFLALGSTMGQDSSLHPASLKGVEGQANRPQNRLHYFSLCLHHFSHNPCTISHFSLHLFSQGFCTFSHSKNFSFYKSRAHQNTLFQIMQNIIKIWCQLKIRVRAQENNKGGQSIGLLLCEK